MILIILILVAIGVGIFFGLARTPGFNDPTDRSNLLTGPPSIERLYDPLSEEDFAAVSRNETIPGQESLQRVKFSTNYAVTLSKTDDGMTGGLVQLLLDAIQET